MNMISLLSHVLKIIWTSHLSRLAFETYVSGRSEELDVGKKGGN